MELENQSVTLPPPFCTRLYKKKTKKPSTKKPAEENKIFP